MAVVPGLILGSIGAGQVNPAVQGGTFDDPASVDPCVYCLSLVVTV